MTNAENNMSSRGCNIDRIKNKYLLFISEKNYFKWMHMKSMSKCCRYAYISMGANVVMHCMNASR